MIHKFGPVLVTPAPRFDGYDRQTVGSVTQRHLVSTSVCSNARSVCSLHSESNDVCVLLRWKFVLTIHFCPLHFILHIFRFSEVWKELGLCVCVVVCVRLGDYLSVTL